ncbi:hypothetical protein [Cupriavidus necator]
MSAGLLLVPRSKQCVEGISVSSLAFAGSLLVRDEAQMRAIEGLGPMNFLRRAAAAAGVERDGLLAKRCRPAGCGITACAQTPARALNLSDCSPVNGGTGTAAPVAGTAAAHAAPPASTEPADRICTLPQHRDTPGLCPGCGRSSRPHKVLQRRQG